MNEPIYDQLFISNNHSMYLHSVITCLYIIFIVSGGVRHSHAGLKSPPSAWGIKGVVYSFEITCLLLLETTQMRAVSEWTKTVKLEVVKLKRWAERC